MNAIAFSLFGTSNLYVNGMIRNAELAKTVYPGWKVVVYADTDVSKVALHKLSKLGVDLRKPIASIPNQMFWRFCIADDPKVERFIVRDSDSRINRREAAAVTEWIDSDLNIHTLRDHPHHWLPIGGGMWGAKTGIFKPSMESLITASSLATNKYTRAKCYSLDQTFLSFQVWSAHKNSCLQHDSCNRHIYPDARDYPTGTDSDRFVGEVFDETDTPHPTQWIQRSNMRYA
jgi:hypothetical protein